MKFGVEWRDSWFLLGGSECVLYACCFCSPQVKPNTGRSVSRVGLVASLRANLWPLLPDGHLRLCSSPHVTKNPESNLISTWQGAKSG